MCRATIDGLLWNLKHMSRTTVVFFWRMILWKIFLVQVIYVYENIVEVVERKTVKNSFVEGIYLFFLKGVRKNVYQKLVFLFFL